MADPKTVKVRVAVAVDPEGNWTAWGVDSDSLIRDYMQSGMLEDLKAGERYYILTATLDLPTPTEVEASVEEIDKPA